MYLLAVCSFVSILQSCGRRKYDGDDSGLALSEFIWLGLFVFIFYIVIKAARAQLTITAHWSHHFADLQMSSQEFYASLEKSIAELQIPDLSISRTTYFQDGILSAKREYLRISRKDLLFDICAAPLGKGYFVSWWQAEQEILGKSILAAIPYIGKSLARQWDPVTYYRLDTEAMFKGFVHAHVLATVDAILAQKGLRGLTEEQRKPIETRP
jgi:hypothetical protein